MSFTAKDVAALRASTGAGMMDCKKALEATGGDIEDAKQWLREKGIAKSAERSDRENTQGCVALAVVGGVTAVVQLKCETDFVASSDGFKGLAQKMAETVAGKGTDALAEHDGEFEDKKLTLKENIQLGRVVRYEPAAGNVVDHYLHVQGGRGVNAVLVEIAGGSIDLAHDVAVHVGFAKPQYLRREDVPADVVEKERATLETLSRNEGKPEAALPKIVEGRINGFFKEICLLEQPYVKDEKQSIKQYLGAATLVRFDQIMIG